jgi:tRNA uridine 5-carboxymethylaminomethyl modification enzyme
VSASFDVIVVGAGHAGCEAAAASARLGRKTACITFSLAHVGRLSCNPAVGGLGKGHLVRELDALGGIMARATDATSIQFRRLNTRKGLAVQASRAQVDVDRYPAAMRALLEQIPGLTLIQAEVAGVRTTGGCVTGVALVDGTVLEAPAVVLTTGTFLGGVLHRGEDQAEGGRIGDPAAHRLSRSLSDLGLRLGRLKTGTVPRLDGRTIHWELTEPQDDTVPEGRFSFGPPGPKLPQVACHQVYTTATAHEVIRANLARSPMYTGAIVGRGPRYCPSIEDKIVRFADKERHLLYLEPEGLATSRVYVNGLSTSLPVDVQADVLRAIPALADATVLQWGYAVEYDFADPTDLGRDLQHRSIPGLFLAGQLNGTSGYEEAAVQGFVAGVSAASGQPFHVERSDAYVGVLVDDLVSRGIGGEPYRMFTSRAEHRLLLREDNADRRLMQRGRALGLIDDVTWSAFEAREDAIARTRAALASHRLSPDGPTREALEREGLGPLKKPMTALELLRRPDISVDFALRLIGTGAVDPAVAEQLEIDTKYAGYVDLAARRRDLARGMEAAALPEGLDWRSVGSLSFEVRERLQRARPATLGQLSRVPGVTPAAVDAVVDLLAR